MAVIQSGSDYEKYFNADRYIEVVYSEHGNYRDVIQFLMEGMHAAFADGKITGGDLLDIGTGPSIHSIVTASKYVDRIYVSDYANRNLEILKSWWKGDRSLQDYWVKQVCILENKGQSVEERVKEMRQKVKDVAFIDILTENSLKGNDLPKQYDVITSCYCLDGASSTKDEYKTSVRNVFSLLKPGGYFVNMHDLDYAVFNMDDDEFHIIQLNSTEVEDTFKAVGFSIESFKIVSFEDDSDDNPSFKSFVLVAKKCEE